MCFSFIARAKRQTEESTFSDAPLRSIVELPVVQDLLQKIDKLAIAPLRHSLVISDFHPSQNPDIDARAEVKRYVNMPATYSYVEADTQLISGITVSGSEPDNSQQMDGLADKVSLLAL